MYLKFSDGSKYKIPNVYLIAAHKNKYVSMDATFITDAEVIHAPLGSECDKCRAPYIDQPVKTIFFSEDKDLNRQLGRPGRVCVICYFRPYHEAGHKIPSPLAPHF